MSLDFNGFQMYQNAKIVDNTIALSELVEYCPPLFLHIHRHKAACRDQQKLAGTYQSRTLVPTRFCTERIAVRIHDPTLDCK